MFEGFALFLFSLDDLIEESGSRRFRVKQGRSYWGGLTELLMIFPVLFLLKRIGNLYKPNFPLFPEVLVSMNFLKKWQGNKRKVWHLEFWTLEMMDCTLKTETWWCISDRILSPKQYWRSWNTSTCLSPSLHYFYSLYPCKSSHSVNHSAYEGSQLGFLSWFFFFGWLQVHEGFYLW